MDIIKPVVIAKQIYVFNILNEVIFIGQNQKTF